MTQSLNQLIASGKLPLKSQGASMRPILFEDDIVYFKKIPFPQIKVNDIIVFKKKNELICHRVIYKETVLKKKSPFIITKGDNSLYADGKIYPRQILGKVYRVKRNGKTIFPETLYLIQSSQYFNEIIKIKNEFDQTSVNYLFLKGLPLHLYFEGRHPKRLYADCDVLIEKKDFEKAEKILLNLGYQKIKSELSSLHKELKEKEIENAYYKNVNGFMVIFDLHLEVVFMMTQLGKLNALYPQNLISQLTNEFLRLKKTIKINGEKFLILNPSYLILYLALHIFHHNFTGAFRYQFLDTVIRKLARHFEPSELGEKKSRQRSPRKVNNIPLDFSLDEFRDKNDLWFSLSKKIKEYQLQNFVYSVFLLLKKYYHTPIPSSFFSSIKPSAKSPTIMRIFRWMNFYPFKPLNLNPFILLPKINLFNDEPRIKAGTRRFFYLFLLSPKPFYKKILVFFNPAVVYSIWWVLLKKVFSIKKLIIHRDLKIK